MGQHKVKFAEKSDTASTPIIKLNGGNSINARTKQPEKCKYLNHPDPNPNPNLNIKI